MTTRWKFTMLALSLAAVSSLALGALAQQPVVTHDGPAGYTVHHTGGLHVVVNSLANVNRRSSASLCIDSDCWQFVRGGAQTGGEHTFATQPGRSIHVYSQTFGQGPGQEYGAEDLGPSMMRWRNADGFVAEFTVDGR